jgi:hypothetical protein
VTTDLSWRIPESQDDWQCDRESAKLFQLRYFRSLPLIEKIRAVEEMCRVARLLSPRSFSDSDGVT